MFESSASFALLALAVACVGCKAPEETSRDSLAVSGTAPPALEASAPKVPAVQSPPPVATPLAADGRGASVRVDASGRRVLDDGHGRVVVDDGKQSTATDGKSKVVTTPTGTKATSSDGRSVQINKDGTVTVPGVGKVPAP